MKWPKMQPSVGGVIVILALLLAAKLLGLWADRAASEFAKSPAWEQINASIRARELDERGVSRLDRRLAPDVDAPAGLSDDDIFTAGGL